MTDLRALVARMADELDYYRQLLMDDRRETHALAAEARAALAESDGPAVQSREPASVVEQPSDEAVECWAEDQGFVRGYAEHPCGFWIDTGDIGKIARAVLARWGTAPPQAIPVSERLPGAGDCAPWPGMSDANVWCWAGSDVDYGWKWQQRSAVCLLSFPDDYTHWLPFNALPLPSGEVE